MPDFIYMAFYKPYGVLSSFTGEEGKETLKNYIDVQGIYSAGRLDFDSEGLLLLTNDGGLIHHLTDPRRHQPKTYLAQVEGTVTQEALVALGQGVTIHGWQTRPAKVMEVPEPDIPPRVKPITPHGRTTWLRLVLTEGKKRQIRHMTAAVGLPTLRLVRVAIGPVVLGDLRPGEWRYLSESEIAKIKG